jgi:hypothetical protein
MTVTVEQRHIEFSKRGSYACPIARAIREAR